MGLTHFDPPDGFKVSKFVTDVVKPKAYDIGVECYVISDQGKAFERGNVFGNPESRKLIYVREPGPDDMVPTI